jgi:RHS repeat-associated protein
MHTNTAMVSAGLRLNKPKALTQQYFAALLSVGLLNKQRRSVGVLGSLALSLLLGFPLITLAAPPNAAPTPPAQVRGLGSSSQVALQNGAFTASTPIEAPAFHGVTPSLSLDYSSSGGNGFLGVGYALSGFPEIEREYKGGAIVYRYNGEPLVASYALGGSHATLRQSFLRISYNTSTWQITQPNGTVMTLSQIANNRWGISSVRDSHGNTANYSWSCNVPYYTPNDTCYPASVSYGNAAINIYKELRTDIDTLATGENDHVKRRYRLNAFAVTLGGNSLRTYKLTYATSARTGRSLVTNIQQFDRSAFVYGDGLVSGGVSLPMTTATWSDISTQFDNAADISNSYGLTALIWANSIIQNADFNGDGREDFLLRYTYGGSVTAYLLLANNSGGFNYAVDVTNSFGMNSYKWQYAAINPGDFNGDGKQDLLLQIPFSAVQQAPAQYNAYTLIADSSGGFMWLNDIAASTGISAYGWGFTVRVGDFNGDGISDLLLPNQNNANTSGSNPPAYWASVVYADTTGSFGYANNIPSSSALTSSQWATAALTLADFDGDGYTDVLAQTPSYITNNVTYPNKAFVLLAKPLAGTLFSTFTEITNLGGLTNIDWFCGTITPGDFNGDGKADIVLRSMRACVNHTAATPKLLYANGNQGTSFASPINVGALYGMTVAAWKDSDLFTGDFNGDGRTDIFARYNLTYLPTGSHRILESSGDGFKTARVVDTSYGLTKDLWRYADRIGDFDGDGDDDIFFQVDNRNWKLPPKMLNASSSFGNAITSIANGYGSTSTVVYASSSNWSNSGNPPRTQTVTSIAVTDGRGSSATTNYAYSGAAWDPVEKRHLGFRYVKATDPSGAYVENIYFQENKFSIGELKESKSFNASGGVMSQTFRAYTGSSTAPWTKQTMQEDVSECNGSGTCKTQRKNYTYNNYGNVTNLVEQGDTAVIGDERNTSYIYNPNPSSYITGLPAEEILRAGPNTAGQILRHKRNYYDGSASVTSAPLKGDVTRTEQLLSTTGAFIGSNATYDTFGNKLTETDPLGATTTTTWEGGYGRYPLSISNALGHTTTFTWNPFCGQKSTATDPNLAVTTYYYDYFCRITKELRADGGYTATAYTNFGNTNQYISTTINDGSTDNNGLGNSQWTASYFDGLGREWQSFNSSSERVDTTYNNLGLVASVSAPAGSGEPSKLTSYQYDALQRVTRKTFPGGTFQQYLYDAWTVTTCDELGKPRTRYSDAYGQIRKVREYTGKTCAMAPVGTLGTDMFDTVIDYDLVGQQTGFTNAKGYVSSSTFDSLGRRTSRIDPDMGTWNYVYDDKGRLISQTDAKAQTILLSYDALDRVVQKTTPTGQSLAYFKYDLYSNGIGRRSVMCVDICTPGIGTAKLFYYDIMGRLVDERTQVNKSVSGSQPARTYDGAGRVKTLTYPNQEIVANTYDSAGRLNSVVSSAFASNNIVTAATYNARGNLVTRTLGNGVVETFTYDPNRFWLTGVSASLGATLIHSVTLTRNARGEVTGRSNTLESNDNWSYIYDDLRRMTSATNTNNAFWSESFTFDEINRITSSSRLGTYSYGAIGSGKPAYAPQNIGGATLNYDANGNMSSDGVTALVFDVENRPINVGGIASTYNPDGERTSVGTVSFTHDVSEYDSATGITTNYYLFGESRVASNANQQLTFYHGDHLNSASTMTNNVGGVIGRQVLSPFGRKLSTGGYTGPIGLAGQRLDITGLYHMGAREMNPSLGIFVTADPSGAPDPEKPQTLSRYAYANNTPTNLVDPTGYQAKPPENIGTCEAACRAEYLDINTQYRLEKVHTTGLQAAQGMGWFTEYVAPWFTGLAETRLATEGRALWASMRGAKAEAKLLKTEMSASSSVAKNGVWSISPSSIRFSQSSVNGVQEIAVSMRANGWVGAPVDVVRMSDGGLTAFDNTRVLAASRAGIDVKAVIHEVGDSFPVGRWTPKKGNQPTTWGEAVTTRIQQQNSLYKKTYPNGSQVTGSAE